MRHFLSRREAQSVSEHAPVSLQVQAKALLGIVVNVDPGSRPYDPRYGEAICKLKGRSMTIEVMLSGFPPSDARGTKPAMERLRRLGDLAAESNVRIGIYHPTMSWAQGFAMPSNW